MDYILVNLIPHSTEPPSFEKAVENQKLYSAAGRNNKGRKISEAFTLNIDGFKKEGSGVYLYFSLIKMLLITFLFISFMSLPIFLSNYKGNGLAIYGENSLTKAIMKLSLGNQRHEEYDTVIKD